MPFLVPEKLVIARLMPNDLGRKQFAERGLIAGLDGFEIGFSDVDSRHFGLSFADAGTCCDVPFAVRVIIMGSIPFRRGS